MANVQKYTRGATGNMTSHYERKKKENGEYAKFGNQDIDTDRSHLNYNLAPERKVSQIEFIEKRLSEVRCMNRADVNVMCSWVVTLPKDEHIIYEGKTTCFAGLGTKLTFAEMRHTLDGYYGEPDYLGEAEYSGLNREARSEFFRASYEFLEERYGKDNVISAYVHMDENQPHMHFAFVPVTKDKKKGDLKVSAKEVLDREELRCFHEDYSNFLEINVPEFSYQVVNEATINGNKTVTELKRATELQKQAEISRETSILLEQKSTLKNETGALRGEIELLRDRGQKGIESLKNEKNALEREKTALTREIDGLRVIVDDMKKNKSPQVHELGTFKKIKYVLLNDYDNVANELNNYIAERNAVIKAQKQYKERAKVLDEREEGLGYRKVAADQREEKFKAREDDFEMRVVRLDNKEKNLNQKEQKLTEKETQVNELHQRNLTIHQRYNELLQLVKGADKKLKETAEIIIRQQNEIKSLKQQIAEFPQKLAEAVEPLKEGIMQAWTSCKAVVQAVGFLRYSEGDYKANLTDKQARLIDAVSNYARDWAEHDGFPEIAKEIDTKISISKGIQNHIDDLMPKQQQRQARRNDFELG